MTLRQKEFCRHYTSGKTARQAAEAAGYASITCERNAARLLKSPQVMRRITRLRKAKGIVTIQDLEKTRKEMMHCITSSGDDRLKIWAANRLLQILKVQESLDADQLIDQEEEMEKAQPEINQPGVKSHLQLLDHEGKPIKSQTVTKTLEQAEEREEAEADLLPTGQPAFDLKLAPQKLAQKEPQTAPVTVVFRPTKRPLEPLEPPKTFRTPI